jgi:hypothetical protein
MVTSMGARRVIAVLLGLALTTTVPVAAQQPADSVLRRQQRTLDSLAAALRSLQARLDSIERARGRGDTAATDELAALRAAAAVTIDSAAGQAPAPARLGQNALNPEISVTGDVRASAFRPGPQVDNFEASEFEVAFQSALDPYATAKVFVGFRDGEVEVEEGYVFWSGLPGHLRLDAGLFRQTIGELNRWHAHALPEDEYPLVLRRYAGDEGLAQPGISLYWPLPFSGDAGTYEWTVQATAGTNDVLFDGAARPAVLSQLSGFWNLGRSSYAMASITGSYGTAPDTGLTTTLGVLALRYTWRPPAEATRREFTVRGEVWALDRRFTDPSPAFDATRFGAYAGATWRMSRRWIAGVRGDWVQSAEPGPLETEWAVTPTLTFWQSEFVYLRLLWEHARGLDQRSTDRLTLQAVFAMGPHKHELF